MCPPLCATAQRVPPLVRSLATDLNLTPTSLNTERINDDSLLPAPLRILKAVVPTEQVRGAG